MSNKMNNKFTKTFILSRLLLLFALVCPLSILAQATLTPVAELTLNEDGTTYTVTYKAVEGTPTYVTEGVGTYNLVSNLTSDRPGFANGKNITSAVIDASMEKNPRPLRVGLTVCLL